MKLRRPVTLGGRLTIVAAGTFTLTIVLASVLIYVFERNNLLRQVDGALRQRAADIQARPFQLHDLGRGGPGFFNKLPPPSFGAGPDYVQLVDANGNVARPPNERVAVPVDNRTRDVAAGKVKAYFRDVTVSGVHARVLTAQLGPGVALQVVRSLKEVDQELDRLTLILLFVSLGGVLAAALASALVARATLAPVRRLTQTAERVAETRDPSERVPADGRDELSRLGGAFNKMLAELDDAIETQKRFVADASHELRTPLTSVQTNVEMLARTPQIAPADKQKLLDDLQREIAEMRGLVSGLVELARGREDGGRGFEQTRVDELGDEQLERAHSRFPEVKFEAELEPTTAQVRPERLERAVWNLLENAGKWSEPGGVVAVSLLDRELSVRDHGPGVAEEDRPHVFERFYRATAAKGMPGSGLGLSIVHDVVKEHGWTVEVEDAEGGGAVFRLKLQGNS